MMKLTDWGTAGIRLCAALTLSAAGAVGAAQELPAPPGPTTTTETKTVQMATEEDDGRTFSLNRGESLRVTLTGTPSTGFGWRLVEGIGTALVLQDGPRYQGMPSAAEARPGAPVQVSWHLLAARTGTQRVRFIYVRPWEADREPARELSLQVEVR